MAKEGCTRPLAPYCCWVLALLQVRLIRACVTEDSIQALPSARMRLEYVYRAASHQPL